jgi:tRNA(Ile)-lysidine synthase
MPSEPTSLIDRVQFSLARAAVNGRVAIAFSGGLDSMALLDVVASLRGRFPAMQLEAIHVHHGLSPNAEDWAAFCRCACDVRGVPLTVARVRVDRAAGQGLEAAARAARYAAFEQLGARTLLSAQHADDQAETVLHQMLRGTGFAGLAGMGEVRVLPGGTTLLRPLLGVRRAQIEAYAREARLEWIEDESNADTALTRNFLRHEVIPRIAARFPHAVDSLARLARHAAAADRMLDALARIDLAWDGRCANAQALDGLPLERQTNALYFWLRWHAVTPPSSEQLEEWSRQLFRAPPAGKPHRAGGHGLSITRSKDRLQLERRPSRRSAAPD